MAGRRAVVKEYKYRTINQTFGCCFGYWQYVKTSQCKEARFLDNVSPIIDVVYYALVRKAFSLVCYLCHIPYNHAGNTSNLSHSYTIERRDSLINYFINLF